MSKVIQHSEMHHSDDTNDTVRTQVNEINRYVNHDMQLIVPCLIA